MSADGQRAIFPPRVGALSGPAVRNPRSVIRGLREPTLLLLCCLVLSCGYRFSGVPLLPQGIRSVSFAEFENETLEVGVEKELRWALEREFRNHGGIAVTEGGEGILNLTLRRLDLRPLSFDERDQVLEYELALVFDVSLTHRDTGQLLWQANDLRVAEDYSAIPQVLVTTSPEFWQGTLNPEDLGLPPEPGARREPGADPAQEGLTDIQFSETQRRLAAERLFPAAAREVYFRLGENF